MRTWAQKGRVWTWKPQRVLWYNCAMPTYKTVPDFLNDLDADKRAQVESLRSLIKSAHGGLAEHIKWNAPSYVLDGEDRITFNLKNKENVVQLVLHMGATRPENKKGAPILADALGLIRWQSDIRGVVSFADLVDVESKQDKITDLIKRWLAIS